MIGRWIFLRDGRLSGRSKLVLAAIFVIALIATFPLRLVGLKHEPRAVGARRENLRDGPGQCGAAGWRSLQRG